MRTLPRGAALLFLSGLTVAALSSCVDESVVQRDSHLFDDPPTAAMSFLGFSDQGSKLTVCGNCHVEKQSEWEKTAHAMAWSDLQGSGAAEQSCEGCHAVNALGNEVTGDAGWIATRDTRFQDVQCESCHGPGLAHVTNPKDDNIPLPSVDVDLEATNGCGECHRDLHYELLQEWQSSAHSNLYASVAARDECAACHTGNHALEAWGVKPVFVEALSGVDFPITCAVCHDPHGGPFGKQLRFSINTSSVETNLCMKCHQRLGNPDFEAAAAGPHSPQGPLLLGTAGWWPPNLTWTRIVSSHGTPEANPRLCAGCHVAPFEVTDPSTGEFVVGGTSHIFSPIPCLDPEGRPVARGNCADSERTFLACTGSGCHEDEDEARTARTTAQARIAQLRSVLASLLDMVPSTEFNANDRLYTSAEGAEFNRKLARGGAYVHNPFLMETLLLASIELIRSTYGVALSPPVTLEPMLEPSAIR
jgi:predicted CXXCH cytochrome family protein